MPSSKSKSKSRTKQLSSTRPTFPTNAKSNSTSTSTPTSNSTPSTSLPSGKPLPIPFSRKISRLSSRTTQSIITTHHILNKHLHSAIAVHGEESQEVREIREEIERRGGLKVYQDASFTGQMGERGGDSSGVLVAWLRDDESLKDWLMVGTRKAGSGKKEGKQGKNMERARRYADGDGEDAVSETTAQEGGTRKRKRVDENHESEDESTTPSDAISNTSASANPHSSSPTEHHDHQPPKTLRILEIGALSPTNHLSTLQLPKTQVQIRRIDLRSTHPKIEQQDFMTLDPQEVWQGEIGYDVLSLSLVLNFVGDARGRGEMLGWTRGFFRRTRAGKVDGREVVEGGSAGDEGGERRGAGGGADKGEGGSRATIQDTNDNDSYDDDGSEKNDEDEDEAEDAENTNNSRLLPALFLVLPLPTLTNSRYLTEPHLTKIMACLGYTLTRVKRSAKVYYSLWRFEGEIHSLMRERRYGGDGDGGDGGMTEGKGFGKRFGKKELRGGRERNNFCIVLD